MRAKQPYREKATRPLEEQVKANADAHALACAAAPDDRCMCGHARKDHCCAPAGHECNVGWDRVTYDENEAEIDGCDCEKWRPVVVARKET